MTDQNGGNEETHSPEVEGEESRVAKPGVVDAGEIVTGAGGEKMSGLIADIADGD